jgi:Putative beta-barrel porin 2
MAAAVIAIFVAIPSARALVSLEDGRDRIFVDGMVEMGYDSNLFANSHNQGSFSTQGTLGAEYARRAGWIGVNVEASLTFARYANFRNQDYVDPKISAEFTKQTGRTTGSLTMGVQREDRADVTVNTRDTSWNYDAGLDLQYPIIERYSITASFDYNRTDYLDKQLFTDLTTYTGNLYLYYILNEQRDLFIDTRTRYSYESNGETDVDNALSAGVSGHVVGPFNGSLQFGYQVRTPHGGPDHGNYNDLTASGTTTWNINRRMTLTGTLSRDFSTTALAQSIESSRAGLTFQDSLTAKASLTLSGAVGEDRFLGVEGELQPSGEHRDDTFYSLSAGYYYTINQHLKFSINYTFYRSNSNLDLADFDRDQIYFTVTSHW